MCNIRWAIDTYKSREERQREINTKYFEGQMFIAEAFSY